MNPASAQPHRFIPLARHPKVKQRLAAIDKAFRAGKVAEIEPDIQALKAEHPRIAEVDVMLARVLGKMGRWSAAWNALERALQVAPTQPALLALKAQLLEKLEDPEGSDAALETLLHHHPDHLSGRLMLLSRQHQSGDLDAAEQTLDILMVKAPDNPSVLYQFSMMRTVPDDDPLFARMEVLLDGESLTLAGRSLTAFALGNLYLAAGRNDDAFRAYQRGNQLLYPTRDIGGLHPAKVLDIWQNSGLTSRFFAQRSAHGLDDNRLALVLGASRSGKSLVESVLSRHPRVTPAGESFKTGRDMVEQIAGHDAAEYMSTCSPDQAHADAHSYLARLGVEASDDRYRVDTLPENLWRLPMLALWFPKMPLIFCQRDPLDQGVSIFCRYYDTGNQPYFDLQETGHYLGAYNALLAFFAEMLPNPILWVHYEDLVNNPQAEAQRLYAFLDLHQDAAPLDDLSDEAGNGEYRHLIDSHDRPTVIRQDGVGIHQRFADHLAPLKAGYHSSFSQRTSKPVNTSNTATTANATTSHGVVNVTTATSAKSTNHGPTLAQVVSQIEAQLASRNPYAALNLATRVLKQRPKSATCHRLRAEALSRIGHDAPALKLLKALIDQLPANVEPYDALIDALLRADQPDTAAQILTRHPQPEQPQTQRRRVAVAAQQAQSSEAVVALARQLIERFPDDAELHSWLACLVSTDEAETHHQKALELAPNHPGVAYRYAMTQQGEAKKDALWHACTRYPLSRDTRRAYQALRQTLPRDLAALHERIASIWAGYKDEDLSTSFGDYGLPYQAFEPLYLPGTRPAMARLNTYRLADYLPAKARALDIGCNHGYLLMGLADTLSHGEGFDISRACVDIGQTVAQHLGHDHLQLRHQTFDDFMATTPEPFDLVIACAVHRWIGMPLEQFGYTLKRLTVPGGLVLVESQGLRSPERIEEGFGDKVTALCQTGFDVIHHGTICDDGINKRGFALLRHRS